MHTLPAFLLRTVLFAGLCLTSHAANITYQIAGVIHGGSYTTPPARSVTDIPTTLPLLALTAVVLACLRQRRAPATRFLVFHGS